MSASLKIELFVIFFVLWLSVNFIIASVLGESWLGIGYSLNYPLAMLVGCIAYFNESATLRIFVILINGIGYSATLAVCMNWFFDRTNTTAIVKKLLKLRVRDY